MYLTSLSIDGAIDVLLHSNALAVCNVEPTKANDGIHFIKSLNGEKPNGNSNNIQHAARITWTVHGMSPHLKHYFISLIFHFLHARYSSLLVQISCALYNFEFGEHTSETERCLCNKTHTHTYRCNGNHWDLNGMEIGKNVDWLLLTVRQHMLPIQMMSPLAIRPQNYSINSQRFGSPCLQRRIPLVSF